MPEDEAQEQQSVAEAPEGGGFLGGTRGWIILVTTQLLWVLAVVVLLKYKTGADFKDQDKGKKQTLIKLSEYNKYTLPLKDLNYSVRLQTGQTATLAMELAIVLGMFQDELDKGKSLSPEDWKKYMDALAVLEPEIRDKLQQYISQQTYAQLNSTSGREKIKEVVKDFVNNRLKNIDLGLSDAAKKMRKERVTNVFIVTYYMQ